ncbi:MAG: 3-phosphoserine/phosphohydroxythreonine transaminase [Saprospiraceae bacterium]|nr:3-phosphoserine/phosphohydroxythreonine transaminase [Candidatus Brachybacter algidus]
MKIHNFSAGPSILPQEVFEEAARAVLDFNGSGMSLLEMSHRTKPFEDVMDEAHVLVKELFGLSDDFSIAFVTGGASTQFFQIPMNLLNDNDKAVYIDTGVWANKAIKEAKNFGQTIVAASSKESNYNYIPKDYTVDKDAKYLHLTSNNTIYGTQQNWWPDVDVPIVCDMSSDIFSRDIPIDKFGLIYAGAQKNMGSAGVTMVAVRKDMLGHVSRTLPAMLDYRTHIDNGSMYNTPPVFPIYVSMLVMRWIKKMGGVKAMETINDAKAKILYDEIDRNPLFKGTTAVEDRSKMNVCFVMEDNSMDDAFMALTKQHGISGIKGHRSVGGFRASIYNAMPQSSVQVLVDLMKEFEGSRG